MDCGAEPMTGLRASFADGGSLRSEEAPDEAQLSHWLQRLRTAFPALEETDARLAFSLGEALRDALPLNPDLRLEDFWLAKACVRGDAAALQLFEAHVLSKLGPSLRRVNPSDSFAEEMVQLVREHLLVPREGAAPRLSAYSGKGSLVAFVRATAVHLAVDARRADARHEGARLEDVPGEVLALSAESPELRTLLGRYGPALSRAFSDALAALPKRDRLLLRLHHVEGMSLEKVARAYKTPKSTVGRWIADARTAVMDGVRRTLAETMSVPGSEVDSLILGLRSRLELNLSAALRSL